MRDSKTRFRFSLKGMLVFMSIAAVFFAATAFVIRLRREVTARAERLSLFRDLVDQVVVAEHWNLWGDASPVPQLPNHFQASFLSAKGRFIEGSQSEQREADLMVKLSTRVDDSDNDSVESFSSASGFYTYYQAVRASKSCVVCHTESEVGGVIAIAKIGATGSRSVP